MQNCVRPCEGRNKYVSGRSTEVLKEGEDMDYEIIREKDGVCVLIVNGERYFSGTYEQCDDAKRNLYEEGY